MSNALKFAAVGGSQQLFAEDCFACYTYTGNGSTQTITNGIDLAGEGGMVWIKGRSLGEAHKLCSTTNTAGYYLENGTGALQGGSGYTVSAFNSDGFSVNGGAGWGVNTSAAPYASWTFRNSDRFFNHASVVKSSGSNATASFPGLGTLGMVVVKRTDSTGSWYVWHRSLTAGKLLYLEQTTAEATLGHITVSGTTVTLVDAVITDGTYIVYAWAHDTASDGIIQCGSFSAPSLPYTVTLGWEPQFILFKASTDATDNWTMVDSSRKFPDVPASTSSASSLRANTSMSESTYGIGPTATGFKVGNIGDLLTGTTYIYLAIRRPNKPPTVGTQVYNAIARTGTGAAATVTGVGFAPDLVDVRARTGAFNWWVFDRLRGATHQIYYDGTDTEGTEAQSLTSFGMDGNSLGTNANVNQNTTTFINYFFRRAPGFFDVVCYTGDVASQSTSRNHNLTTVPELLIVKRRNASGTYWKLYTAPTGSGGVGYLNLTDAFGTGSGTWNSTSPTSSLFYLGQDQDVNEAGGIYVAYLFATLAGISKVGSYTGTAATLQINCGFTTGARFVLIKRTDSTGDWYVWDTVRGIIAGDDPYLLLNSTAAEVTSTDYIDPYSAGFEISSTAPAAINASGGTFIFLAIA